MRQGVVKKGGAAWRGAKREQRMVALRGCFCTARAQRSIVNQLQLVAGAVATSCNYWGVLQLVAASCNTPPQLQLVTTTFP